MKIINHFLITIMALITLTAFSQTEKEPKLLGLPGDDLDLYAVMDLFQKSKTIEDFEKSLNEEKTGINNLDLNKDGKVDFIKVETKKEGENFKFILQDPVSKTETQDVAVIQLTKGQDEKIDLQVIGDTKLYGKDFIIKPSVKKTPGVTPNPAYTGDDPVKETVPATTTTVVLLKPFPLYNMYTHPLTCLTIRLIITGITLLIIGLSAPIARAIYWDNRYDRYDDYWDDREDLWDDRQDNLDDRNENRDQNQENRNQNQESRNQNQENRQSTDKTSAKQTAGTKESGRASAGTKETTAHQRHHQRDFCINASINYTIKRDFCINTTFNNTIKSYSSSSRATTSSSARQSSSYSSVFFCGASRSMSSSGNRGGGGMSRGGGGRRR